MHVLRPSLRTCLLVALTCLFVSTCRLPGAQSDEIERIAALLALDPGHVLADVGAGDGDFTEGLAAKVGPKGRVFATEVKKDLVKKIRKRSGRLGLAQVEAVLGDQDRIGLTEGCCDAILLRLVYHHFVKPDAMRSELWRALRPGGLIAVIDITPQENWRELPDVPDRGGHGIPTDSLVSEMIAEGFELVSQVDDWNGDEDRFALVFKRPEA